MTENEVFVFDRVDWAHSDDEQNAWNLTRILYVISHVIVSLSFNTAILCDKLLHVWAYVQTVPYHTRYDLNQQFSFHLRVIDGLISGR